MEVRADISIEGFFRNYQIGKKGSLHGGVEAMPDNKVSAFGHELSLFQNFDENGHRVSAVLYSRQQPGGDLYRAFNRFLTQRSGEATEFKIPNFEDATERDTKMLAWKDEKHLLLLQQITDSSFQTIQLELHDIDHYNNNLGADYGAFVRKAYKENSGKLSILGLVGNTPKSVKVIRQKADRREPIPEVRNDRGGEASYSLTEPDKVVAKNDRSIGRFGGYSLLILGLLIVVLIVILSFFKAKLG